ncbi:MAG: hypothetical protein K5641_03500 [Lachnospiraceae bacterium]|nr:hypothetical protein [Lachnospiraceae bacterium]
MSVVAHNLQAMAANRYLGITGGNRAKSSEKLSSGYKINRAADDAAGLSISEKMRKQIRGLTRASLNAEDGISMVQVADGALTEVHEMLQRGNELMIQAANGTLSDADREAIGMEVRQLKDAIDQVATSTKFNETYLFPEDGFSPAMASEVVDKIVQEYVPNAVNQILDKFPTLKNIIDSTYTGDAADKLKMDMELRYVDGSGGTLALVEGNFHKSNQTLASISLTVDSSDFSEADVTDNSSKLGKLESTIAHEMMHAVMDAAHPARMKQNGGVEDLPLWFSEGVAQLAGGGFTTGWNDELKDIVDDVVDDDNNEDVIIAKQKIAEYLKKYKISDEMTKNDPVQNRVYGHGYLAAAYMGYIANGNAEI